MSAETLRDVVVTYQVDPPPEAPDDVDLVEVDLFYDSIQEAIADVPGRIGRTLDGYGRGRVSHATIAARMSQQHQAVFARRIVVADYDRDGWEPGVAIADPQAGDDDLLDVLGTLGDAIRRSVVDEYDRAPLARLMLHAANSSGRAPAVCGDCAADDDCGYQAVTTLLSSFRFIR